MALNIERMKFIFVLLLLLPGVCVANENLVKLSENFLDQKLGKQWQGIAYICDPYCRFLSLREGVKWSPAVPSEDVDPALLKGISKNDPIYPLLVSKLPVLPYVLQKNAGSEGKKDSSNGADELPPDYAKMPFNYAWSLTTGLYFTSLSVNSDTSVESKSGAKSPFQGLSVGANLMKGSPNRLFGQWIQQSLHIGYDMAGSYKTADQTTGKYGKMEILYQIWRTGADSKMGPRLGVLQETSSFQTDSIEHYSTNQNLYIAGFEYIWRKRWFLDVDTSFMGQIHEKQNFRQGAIQQQWYRLSGGYCSPRFGALDMHFGFCTGLGYTMDTQSASLADNLFVSDSHSKISRSEMTGQISLRFGEDFFQ